MKIAQVAFLSTVAGIAGGVSLRGLTQRGRAGAASAAEVDSAAASDGERRALQAGSGCYGRDDTFPTARWHPNYGAGWIQGYCHFTVDCDSPGYDSELDCCKGSYSGQTSGHCLSRLDSPPTTSPTDAGGLGVYYPDYDTVWAEATCINARPMPSGRPTYGTMLACCKGAYGGQVSGKCLSILPASPTTSPTSSSMEADFWYPDYDTAWSIAGCSNQLPLPYANVNDRPNYPTQLECCKGAYGGQISGACISQLPNPPTTSPTGSGGLDYYYPDYDTAWSIATCKNDRPLPFSPGGRPVYDTMLECCKGAYGGQVSGACLSALPAPPTTSPTGSGGLDYYYPDYDAAWSIATCKNDGPPPFSPGDRPTYATMLECCRGAYGGQVSGACIGQLPAPPTTSPTGSGGLDYYYPDYDAAWSIATCKNDGPPPFSPGDRPTYATMLECCKGAYAGQVSGACISQLPDPPTTSPTGSGGLDYYYPDYDTPWSIATCKNDGPPPFSTGGRPTYATMLECCRGAYAGQVSGACLSALPAPPTTSPTAIGGSDAWYPDYETPWAVGTCKNDAPPPFSPGDRPTYQTMLECCKGAYGGQVSGACVSALPAPPTTSPTGTGGLDVWYPDLSLAWTEGVCINNAPLPNNIGATYASMFECCKGEYGGQVSGKCLGALPSPPTASPATSGGPDGYYRDPDAAWNVGTCISDLPLPANSGPVYATKELCCSGAFGGQAGDACVCDADPCHSCGCGSRAELDARGYGLACE